MDHELLNFLKLYEAIMAERTREETSLAELKAKSNWNPGEFSTSYNIQFARSPLIRQHLSFICISKTELPPLSTAQNELDSFQTQTQRGETRRELLEVFRITIAKLLQQFLIHFQGYFNYENRLAIIQWQKKQMENQVDAHAENLSTMQIDQQITTFLKNLITTAEPQNQTPTYQQLVIFIQLQVGAKIISPGSLKLPHEIHLQTLQYYRNQPYIP